MNGPCKYCENKGCGIYHDKCEKYKAFKKEREEARRRQLDHGFAEEDLSLRMQRMKRSRSTNGVINTHKR